VGLIQLDKLNQTTYRRQSDRSCLVASVMVVFCLLFGLTDIVHGRATSSEQNILEFWFDEGSGDKTLVRSASGTFAIPITNGPEWSDSVRFSYPENHSLRFHGGKKWIDVGSFQAREFTVEGWVNYTATTDQTYLYIGQAGNEEGLKFHLRLHRLPEGWAVEANLWDKEAGTWKILRSSGGVIEPEKWNHVAFTYDGTEGGKLYANGELVGSMEALSSFTLDRYWRIGHPFGSAMVGVMDEIRISDFARVPGDGSGDDNTLAWNSTLHRTFPIFLLQKPALYAGPTEIASSVTRQVRVENAGNDVLRIDSVRTRSTRFDITPGSAQIAPGYSLDFTVSLTPMADSIYTGSIIFRHNGLSSVDTLRVVGSGYSNDTTNIAAPLFQIRDTGIMGCYIVAPTLKRAWSVKYGIPDIYDNPVVLKDVIDYAVRDIKSLGFNSIVLSTYRLPSDQVDYLDYVTWFAEAGERYGVGIIPSFEVPAQWGDDRDTVWAKSGEFSNQSKTFVDNLVQYSSIVGFNHIFEVWGRMDWDPVPLMQIRSYIESKDRFYLMVPAAGTHPPAGAYTVATSQVNPQLFNTQDKMDAEVKEWATNAYEPESGIEINIGHNGISPEYGYPEGEEGQQRWLRLQRNALLKYQPDHITLFLYYRMVIEHDPSNNKWYYTPRGAVKHILEKVKNQNLLLYDPRVSDFSTEIISGVIEGSKTTYPVYDEASKSYNLETAAGLISLWLPNHPDGDSGDQPIYVTTDTSEGSPFLLLEKTQNSQLLFQLSPNDSASFRLRAEIPEESPGERYQVAGSWHQESGQITLAVNGTVQAETTVTWQVGANPTQIYVDNLGFEGADLRIYNSPLTLMKKRPSLLYPENGAVNIRNNLQLQWTEVDSMLEYWVQVSADSLLDSLVVDLDGVTQTTVPVELDSGTTYYWRIGAVNDLWITLWSPVWSFITEGLTSTESDPGIPEEFRLGQNYPNPFNPLTTIRYQVPEMSQVQLMIYDIRGRRILTLVDRKHGPGYYDAEFKNESLPSGVYLYTLQAAEFKDAKKMVILK